jgi:2,4-dienoyl-CoA reductase-like NADH-dependent reductase (Old Yellow Enzyme family)
MFVGSAKLVEKAGWDGVQIHSAHGYLLAEFLSPLVRSENTV